MAILTDVYDWSFVRLPKRFTLPFLFVMFLYLGFVFPYMIYLRLKMDSRELSSHRLFRVTCLTSGPCSIEVNR